MAGLSGARGYAQIGHGGYDAAPAGGGSTAGDIFVRSRTEMVDLRWGGNNVTGVGNYIQLGHGGYVSDGTAARSDLSGTRGRHRVAVAQRHRR